MQPACSCRQPSPCTHQALGGRGQQDGGVGQQHLLGVHQAVLAQQLDGAGDDGLVVQVGNGGQAGEVGADLQHQGAALEGVGDGGKLGGHGSELGGGLGGALGGLSLAGSL